MGENVVMYDMHFMIFGDDCNGLTTSEIAQILLSPHSGKVPAKPGIGVSLSRPGTSNSTENRSRL